MHRSGASQLGALGKLEPIEQAIEPARTTMNVDGRQIPLVSGMTVTAEIRTERRRAISYILSPLVDTFSTAAMNGDHMRQGGGKVKRRTA